MYIHVRMLGKGLTTIVCTGLETPMEEIRLLKSGTVLYKLTTVGSGDREIRISYLTPSYGESIKREEYKLNHQARSMIKLLFVIFLALILSNYTYDISSITEKCYLNEC